MKICVALSIVGTGGSNPFSFAFCPSAPVEASLCQTNRVPKPMWSPETQRLIETVQVVQEA